MKSCLWVTQADIKRSVSQVVKFFSDVRCPNGSEVDVYAKSKVLVHKPSQFKNNSSKETSAFWKDVELYEGQRDQGDCLVVGCKGIEAKHCIRGLNTSYIVFAADDFNTKSFDKQIGT